MALLKRPLFWISSLAVLGLLAAPMAMARAGFGGHGGGLERKVERLDLDDATLEQVYAIFDATRNERRALRRQMRSTREGMRELLEQETPSEEMVMAQADALGALATEARKQKLKTLLQVNALLSPDQRAKLRQMMRKKGRHDRGKRGSRPDGKSFGDARF